MVLEAVFKTEGRENKVMEERRSRVLRNPPEIREHSESGGDVGGDVRVKCARVGGRGHGGMKSAFGRITLTPVGRRMCRL